MTNIKDMANDVINRAKNLKEFIVKRDIEDVPFTGTFKYTIRHTHGKPVEIFLFMHYHKKKLNSVLMNG